MVNIGYLLIPPSCRKDNLIVSGLMAWTANLGGQVHHPEIRAGPNATVSGMEQRSH
jgi:hypothetical protein